MRLALFALLLPLTACTGEWGDWMQAEKPNEDKNFFCQYYDQCGKGEGKSIYRADHNVSHSGGGVYEVDKGIWGGSKGSDLYGSPAASGGGSVWGPAQ